MLGVILATVGITLTAIYYTKEFLGFDLVPRNFYILKTDLTDSYVSKEDYLKLSSELKFANEKIANLKNEQLLISKNIETLNELSMQGKQVIGKYRGSSVLNTPDDSDFQKWKYQCLSFLKKNDTEIYQDFSTATTLPIITSTFDITDTIENGIAVLEGYKLSLVNNKKGDSK